MLYELKNRTSGLVVIPPQIRIQPRKSDIVEELTVDILKAREQNLIEITEIPEPTLSDELRPQGGGTTVVTLSWGTANW